MYSNTNRDNVFLACLSTQEVSVFLLVITTNVEGLYGMSICESIKQQFIRLSKGQRKVAQYVVDNPGIVATQTAAEVGRLANVSESTVIRFCYAIGLNGYVALQELLRDYLLDKTGAVPISTTHLAKQQRKQTCSYIMQKDLKGIQDTMQLVNEDNFEKSAQSLYELQAIHILGVKGSFPAASWLAHALNQLRDDIYMVKSEEDVHSFKLPELNEKTLFILFAFEGDLMDAKRIAEIAKARKSKVLVITDTAFSPLRPYANAVFTIGSQQQTSIEKTPALFTFLHALVEAMANKQQAKISS